MKIYANKTAISEHISLNILGPILSTPVDVLFLYFKPSVIRTVYKAIEFWSLVVGGVAYIRQSHPFNWQLRQLVRMRRQEPTSLAAQNPIHSREQLFDSSDAIFSLDTARSTRFWFVIISPGRRLRIFHSCVRSSAETFIKHAIGSKSGISSFSHNIFCRANSWLTSLLIREALLQISEDGFTILVLLFLRCCLICLHLHARSYNFFGFFSTLHFFQHTLFCKLKSSCKMSIVVITNVMAPVMLSVLDCSVLLSLSSGEECG